MFQQHARVFGCERTKRAICVDPGGEAEHIVAALERRNFELQAIALTHAHMDHIGAVSALKKLRPNAQVILHPLDEPLYRQLPQQPLWLGIPQSQWTALGFDYEDPPPIERYWSDGETYVVGDLSFEVLHCPGHTPGHIALFESEKRVVVAGDCLFAGSIGRTDLPGGSYTDLMQSLIERIMPSRRRCDRLSGTWRNDYHRI
ncbi:MAG: MBL fold metallo-hydrolase [Pyrinomonadaceae bacterium]